MPNTQIATNADATKAHAAIAAKANAKVDAKPVEPEANAADTTPVEANAPVAAPVEPAKTDEATAVPAASVATMPFSITKYNFSMDLPRKFDNNLPKTPWEGLACDTLNLKYFYNKMNAFLDARAKKFTAAKTEVEKAENAPLSVDEIKALCLKLYVTEDYIANIGGKARSTPIERLRREAALLAWHKIATAHNAAVLNKQPPVITSRPNEPVQLGFKAKDGMTVAEVKADWIEKLLASKNKLFVEAIQTELDILIMAQSDDDDDGADGMSPVAQADDMLA